MFPSIAALAAVLGAVSHEACGIIWGPAMGDHALTFMPAPSILNNYKHQPTLPRAWRFEEGNERIITQYIIDTAICFEDWDHVCAWADTVMTTFNDTRTRKQRRASREPFHIKDLRKRL